MQKIATKVFVIASLVFGILGIMVVIIAPDENETSSTFDTLLLKSFMVTIFIILSSFALSVAGKYLGNGEKNKR